jgi:hypothetical protein
MHHDMVLSASATVQCRTHISILMIILVSQSIYNAVEWEDDREQGSSRGSPCGTPKPE